MRRVHRDMEGGPGNAVLELDHNAVQAGARTGRRRMARLTEQEIQVVLEKSKLPRPVLPVVLPEGFLARDPKRREEFIELRTFMVGEMQQLWDYNKRLVDMYHAHGYIEVLVDDENMWELY